jgi:hypothetical protein
MIPYLISGAFSLAGLAVFFSGFSKMKKIHLIQDTPTSKIRSMAMGIVEIHGNVEAKEYIKAPFSQTDCIYYRFKIEEYRQSVSRDSKGRTTTSYRWDTVHTGEKRLPFFAKDETGQVYVEPKGAEYNVPAKKAFIQRAGLFGAFNLIINALNGWDGKSRIDMSTWNLAPIKPGQIIMSPRVGDRKYTEYYIEPGSSLYVLGTAANDSQILIRKGENEKTFIISDRSEKELLGNMKWQMLGAFALGGILFIAGIVLIILISSGAIA